MSQYYLKIPNSSQNDIDHQDALPKTLHFPRNPKTPKLIVTSSKSGTKPAGAISGKADRVPEDLRPTVRGLRALLCRRHGAGQVDQGVRAAGTRLRPVLGNSATCPGARFTEPGRRGQLRASPYVHHTSTGHRGGSTRAARWSALPRFRRQYQRDVPTVQGELGLSMQRPRLQSYFASSLNIEQLLP